MVEEANSIDSIIINTNYNRFNLSKYADDDAELVFHKFISYHIMS